ncbi:hypothetical protein KC367_g248 [Hortaea werneckii]|nr:hypothetical protein KC367_g248 [Hortaea werneckii]
MIFCSSCTTGNCIRASCTSSSRGIVIAAAGRLVLSPLACVVLATSIGSGEGSRGLKLAFTFSSIWAEVARGADGVKSSAMRPRVEIQNRRRRRHFLPPDHLLRYRHRSPHLTTLPRRQISLTHSHWMQRLLEPLRCPRIHPIRLQICHQRPPYHPLPQRHRLPSSPTSNGRFSPPPKPKAGFSGAGATGAASVASSAAVSSSSSLGASCGASGRSCSCNALENLSLFVSPARPNFFELCSRLVSTLWAASFFNSSKFSSFFNLLSTYLSSLLRFLLEIFDCGCWSRKSAASFARRASRSDFVSATSSSELVSVPFCFCFAAAPEASGPAPLVITIRPATFKLSLQHQMRYQRLYQAIL